MKNSKKIGFILGLIMFILLLVGGTFAFWIWRGTFARVAVTANVPFNCAADGGVHDSTNKLMPAACTHERYAIKREITVDYSLFSPDSSVYMDMILTINRIDPGLRESANFKYALTTEDDSCSKNVIASGTFTNKIAGSKIKLLDREVYSKVGMDIINTYYLYIWIDAKEENRNVLNQNFEFSLSLECTQGPIPGATMLVNKANDETITSYNAGNKGEMYTFSQPATEQVEATTDYRYIGNTPNNYITFNDETWRIIGVFDGKIKIIKDTSIGSMPWDYKKTGIGSSTSENGSNDWVDAQVMYMLNPNDIAMNVALKNGYTYDGTYVKDANGKIIYQNGCKPASTDGTGYSCTENTWSLNSTALSQVVDNIYYLGGETFNSTTHYGTAVDMYTWERGVEKYNDVRSTNWTGKVGLMYPSDYTYSFAYGVDDDCYNDGYVCNNSNPSASWLYTTTFYPWTISSQSNNGDYVVLIRNGGYVQHYTAHFGFGVRPVVYLKSNTLLNGTGTSDDPYVITDIDDYIPPVEEPEVNATDGALMLINKANSSSVTTYNNGNKGEMYTFSQPATEQLSATTDYRYIGNSPNNYITFNDETWRIIGVFDGKIKIIRDATITGIRWDFKKTGIGSSISDYGSNDWVDAQLMYFLNPNDIATNVALKSGYTFDGTYVKDANGKIIYQKGCNPALTDGASYSCTTNSWSLNSTALSQIADVTYYLGGSGYNSTTHYGTTPEIYTWERGETKFNDVRSTSWAGKVGLMYPSDYGYTFAYGVDDVCYNDGYNCQTANSAVPSSSWLYISSGSQWTLAPFSSLASTVFYVSGTGAVYGYRTDDAHKTYRVRPVVYLKSDILLTGTGTVNDKYVIS